MKINLRDGAIITLNQLRDLKSVDPVKSSKSQDEILEDKLIDNNSGENNSHNNDLLQEPEIKRKELIKSGYHIYIEKFVKNSRYNYIEGFNRKSRYDYEFTDMKLRDLLHYRKMEFSDEEILWLIQEEIKNQEYEEFKEKLLSKNPQNLNNYIEILIKTYPDPQNQIDKLERLLLEKNISHQPSLTKEIEKIEKQIEITEFENSILNKNTSNQGVLPVETEDLDDAYISFNIGNLYYDLGKLEKALTYYDKALYIYPDFIDVWKYRGLIYFTSGRLQKAAACYNQILNLDPEYPELWVDYWDHIL